MHRGGIYQFSIQMIHYIPNIHCSESTGQKTGKSYLCALAKPDQFNQCMSLFAMTAVLICVHIRLRRVCCHKELSRAVT